MKARDLSAMLVAAGCVQTRQRGSHKVFKKPGEPKIVTVPDHGNNDLAKGTEQAILKEAGLK